MATLKADGTIQTEDGKVLYGDDSPTVQEVLDLVRSFAPAPPGGFVASGGGGAGRRGARGTGTNGAQGAQGPEGPFGGPQGVQGPVGAQGAQGPVGATGSTGPQGPVGQTGPQGNQGNQGPMGLVGDVGPQGFQGPVGVQGPQGVAGTGAQGPQGLTGSTILYSQAAEPNITLTTAEQSLVSFVGAVGSPIFAANTWDTTGRIVRVTVSGQGWFNGGENWTLRVKLTDSISTKTFTFAATAVPVSASGRAFTLVVFLKCSVTGAAGTINATGYWIFDDGILFVSLGSNANVDLTNSITLDVSTQVNDLQPQVSARVILAERLA